MWRLLSLALLLIWVPASSSAEERDIQPSDVRFLDVVYECYKDEPEAACKAGFHGISGIAFDGNENWYFLSDGNPNNNPAKIFRGRLKFSNGVVSNLEWDRRYNERDAFGKTLQIGSNKTVAGAEAISYHDGNFYWAHEDEDSTEDKIYLSDLSGKNSKEVFRLPTNIAVKDRDDLNCGLEALTLSYDKKSIWFGLEREIGLKNGQPGNIRLHKKILTPASGSENTQPDHYQYPIDGNFHGNEKARPAHKTENCKKYWFGLTEIAAVNRDNFLSLERLWDGNTSSIKLFSVRIPRRGHILLKKNLIDFGTIFCSAKSSGNSGCGNTIGDRTAILDNFEAMAIGPEMCGESGMPDKPGWFVLLMGTDNNFRFNQMSAIAAFEINLSGLRPSTCR